MEMMLKRALDARHTSPSPARVLTTGYAPRCDTAADAVGSTPVLWIDRPLNPEGRGFWAKLEGHNPGGMRPQRYVGTVFNDDYCHRHRLLTAHLPTEPDEIAHPTEREVVRWTRCRQVLDPAAGREER